jgi:hypothetical protein
METSPLQRRVTFGLIALVLVGLVVYLIGQRGSPAAARPDHGSHPVAGTGIQRPSPAVSTAPASSPPASGSADPGSAGSAAPDIYQWLPFTPAELGAAAGRVRLFAADYGTFSYTQSAAGYVAPLQSMCLASLAGQIEAAYSLPGVAGAREKTKQVSTGTATIQSIRAFGPGSITFVVEITEHETATSGPSETAASYAITVAGSGSSWQVTDIELASLGNS